jgi:hypothetical protein
MGQTVTTVNGGNHQVSGIGSTTVQTNSGGINLNRVLCIPALKRSLMLVGSLADEGYILVFTNSNCLILDNNTSKQVIAVGNRDTKNGLYRFPHSPRTFINNVLSEEGSQQTSTDQQDNTSSNNIHLWYKRYGHLHYTGLLHLLQVDRVQGLSYFGMTTHICGACLAGRQCREHFPKKLHQPLLKGTSTYSLRSYRPY